MNSDLPNLNPEQPDQVDRANPDPQAQPGDDIIEAFLRGQKSQEEDINYGIGGMPIATAEFKSGFVGIVFYSCLTIYRRS